jgi:hypothetical protein
MWDPATCQVASLNFRNESTYDFRAKTAYPGYSLSYYNTTDIQAEKDGWFDYYDQPSKNARRLVITSAYLRKPAQDPHASIVACGKGWNCTYTLSFQGPGYNCEEVANSSIPISADKTAPLNISELAPQGDVLYKAYVDMNDYKNPQVETDKNGMPKEGPPYPDTLGVFQSEPVLWIGYASNTTTPYESSSPFAEKWINVHEPTIFKCVAYHTEYEFNVTYRDTNQ